MLGLFLRYPSDVMACHGLLTHKEAAIIAFVRVASLQAQHVWHAGSSLGSCCPHGSAKP